jgi:hypothetical protein
MADDTNRIAQLEADLARAVATIELLTDGVLVPCRREGCKGGFTMAHWWRAGPEREAQPNNLSPRSTTKGQCPWGKSGETCTLPAWHDGPHNWPTTCPVDGCTLAKEHVGDHIMADGVPIVAKPTPRAEGPTPGMCSTGQCPHTTGVRRCTRERDHKGAHVF